MDVKQVCSLHEAKRNAGRHRVASPDCASLHPGYAHRMVRYRRNFLPGGTFFFTATLRDRRSSTLTDNIGTLREAFRVTRREHPFAIDAIVVLPDHLHTIWTLPTADADFSGRWRSIKSKFTHAFAKAGAPIHRNARGEYDLWQRRFWEHTIRDETDFARSVDYIHFNPVKHGLVVAPVDWPHSSLHRFIRNGILSPDWGGSAAIEGEFGEHAKKL